jgi:hypothetical protein
MIPKTCQGYNAAFRSSLNDHKVWEGNIEDVITISICENGRPLVATEDDPGADLERVPYGWLVFHP